MLIRFTPKAKSPLTYSSPFRTISSGFTSTVNSDHCGISLPEGAMPPNPPRFALRPVSPAASHPFMWPRAATGSAGIPLPDGWTIASDGGRRLSMERTIRDKTSSGSTDGVPPPMYKVLTSSVRAISSRRAATSAHTASA